MTDQVQPALSPEEWAEVFEDMERSPIVLGRGHQIVMCIEGNEDGSQHYHRAAAIALARQPYGFTWEDVEALRSTMSDPDQLYVAAIDTYSRLESLADRIQALLPPKS